MSVSPYRDVLVRLDGLLSQAIDDLARGVDSGDVAAIRDARNRLIEARHVVAFAADLESAPHGAAPWVKR